MLLEHCHTFPPLLQEKRCFAFLISQGSGTSKNHLKLTCVPWSLRSRRIWSSCSDMLKVRGHLELAGREEEDIGGRSYTPNGERKTGLNLSQRRHSPRGIR